MRPSACFRSALLVGLLALGVASRPAPAAADDNTWLGVYTQEISPDLREGMNYNGNGALVTRVAPGSPAARAGVQQGDIIVRVGTREIDSPNELVDAVKAMPNGKQVPIIVVRGDAKRSFEATLEARDGGSSDNDRDEDDGMPVPAVPPAPATPRVHAYHGNGDNDFNFDMPGPMTFSYGRGRLGIRVESLNPDLASYFGGRDTRGALVLDVTDGSPADKAGIRAGDVITNLGSKSVTDADDLIEAVRSSEGEVSIALVRHGNRQSVQATLDPVRRSMSVRSPRAYHYDSRSYGNTPRRIHIDGDEMDQQQMQQQMQQMREDMKRMREELDRMHDQQPQGNDEKD
jgi:C-terminal processing protease CtpA/Prc